MKGYFSFNIPNGGWDSLWYKISDGGFVADVDIETGTLDVVAPDCSGNASAPAPAPDSGDRVSHALAWARDEMATNPNSNIQCVIRDKIEQAPDDKVADILCATAAAIATP